MTMPKGHHGMFKPLIERINLDEKTGCWNWIGSKDRKGYGQLNWHGRTTYAHRFSAWIWLKHPLRHKLHVLHRCDNPACFNPKHLFIGTHLENMQDSVRKGRHRLCWNVEANRKKTHCIHEHKFTPENTKRDWKGNRECRTCRRDIGRRYQERHA